MPRDDDDDDDRGSSVGTMLKGGLYALGAVAAIYWVVLPIFFVGFAIAKSVFFLAALAGAGYVGYRMIAGGGGERKAIRGRRGQKALGPGRSRGSSRGGGDDFDRKMRELEAIEKRLDAEIGKH